MNPSKRKGTDWESRIVAYLLAHGYPVERRSLAGSGDKGDIVGIPQLVVEAKATAAYDLPGFLAEVQAEKRNAGAELGVCWLKLRRRTSPAECAVIMSGEDFLALLARAIPPSP